ncbi:MAG: ABC transporter permease [Lachnospiraceae bacterium]|nr:ABC transporter permease [Lachnospiraceae bacterium]
MRKFMGLTKRNLLVYFKDKGAILFSLLTSLIVLVLYLLFLKGTFEDAFESALANAEFIRSFINDGDIEVFVNITLLIGMLGSAMITVPYSCLTTIVKDRENKIDYDISATPIKRWQIVLSYFTAASISACIMTGILLAAGMIILSMDGGLLLGTVDILKAFGMVIIGSVSSTALFMAFMLFFKTAQSSNAFFGMLSAAAGFVIGAYIPISQFSDKVQTFCNLFPATHVTIAIRNILMRGVVDKMNNSIGGLDQGMFVETIKGIFSFNSRMFGHTLSIANSLTYIFVFMAVSVVFMVCAFSKTYKRA